VRCLLGEAAGPESGGGEVAPADDHVDRDGELGEAALHGWVEIGAERLGQFDPVRVRDL